MLTYQVSIGQIVVTMLHDRPDEDVKIEEFFPSPSAEELRAVADELGIGDTLVASHNNMLIQTDGKNILIDPGWGTEFDEHMGQTTQALAEIGLSPEDIDMVVLTHAHGDHYAGMLTPEREKSYPNADYMMWRGECAHYSSADYLDNVDDNRREFMQERFVRLGEYLSFLDANNPTIAKGVRAVHAPGHTWHHIAIEIESGGAVLLAVVDAIIHPIHLNHTDWHWPFEVDPPQLQQTREALIQRAVEKNAIVAAYHMAFPGLGRISREGETYQWTPIVS